MLALKALEDSCKLTLLQKDESHRVLARGERELREQVGLMLSYNIQFVYIYIYIYMHNL